MNRSIVHAAFAAIACIGVTGCEDRKPTCVGDACVPLTCTNGLKDGGETDNDCGGSTCRKCSGGRRCETGDDCFSGDCVAATNTCYGLAVVSFADAVSYESRDKPYVVLSSDIDADGDIDLAVANELASTIGVFQNAGDRSGVFVSMPSPTATGFPTGAYPTGGAIADFNRDGIADVITADYHGNSVSILLGAGAKDTYTLTESTSYPTVPGAETSNLAVGDLNGDNILDVIATNPQAHSVSVFIGRSDGTLQPASEIALGNGQAEPYSVAIGDFDGDGYHDAAIADNRTLSVYIQLGHGDGTFEPAMSRPDIDGMASFILVARDMNLDGNLDLVVANRSSDDVSVLLGHGDGEFVEAIVSSTGPDTGPYSLAVTDFNLDAVPDVVTANYRAGTATVLLGIGDGRFEEPIDAGVTGEYSYGVATGDFDDDGRPDFATANAASNDVAVKMSTAQ
jgi:hypothetical protein